MANQYDFDPDDPQEDEAPINFPVNDPQAPLVDPHTGHIHLPTGDILIPVGDADPDPQESSGGIEFDANLAEHLPQEKLNEIAEELLRGIQADEDSRAEWLENYKYGIKLLGLKIERGSTADAGSTAGNISGLHKTVHPLLLEAVLRLVADACSALLPASGPAKIRDDQPPTAQPPEPQPPMPGVEAMGANGGPPMGMPEMPFQAPMGQQPHAFGGRINGHFADGGYAGPFTPSPNGPDDYVPIHFNSGGYVNGYADGGQPANGQPTVAPSINLNIGQQPKPDGNANSTAAPAPSGGMPSSMSAPIAAPSSFTRDIMADALEKNINHYLTTVAKEYYPDTKRMIFFTGLGGKGIKKVYNCPIRRRVVSESVPIEDFIVSNAMTDLCNTARITHQSKMRPSVLRRMQILGIYRDVPLQAPMGGSEVNPVTEEKADTIGIQPQDQASIDLKDIDHNILETLCELDIPEFAPEQFKKEGLPLPYNVTIEKDSRKILSLRRNWKEDDKECLPKRYYVGYTYCDAIGFYGIGLVNVLGNLTRTLSAIQMEFVDAGMRATFPSFLYSKGIGRQLTNNFMVGPGGGIGLDTGLKSIQEAAMPFPFKDLGPGFVGYAQHLEEYGKALGGTANIQVGEGKQDAPVGTTLALIEQATKPQGAVIKGFLASQGEELELIKERLREDPDALFRHTRRPPAPMQREQLIKALNDYDLVPVSDPNNPTHLHRLAKANMVYQMAKENPSAWIQKKIYQQVFEMSDLGSPDELLAPPSPQAADPKVMAEQAKNAANTQSTAAKIQADLQMKQMDLQDRAAERESKERIADKNLEMEKLRLAQSLAIHSSTTEMAAADRALNLDPEATAAKHETEQSGQALDAAMQHHQSGVDAGLQRDQMQQDGQAQSTQALAEAVLAHHKTETEAQTKRHATETNERIQRHRTETKAAVDREKIAAMKQMKPTSRK